MSTEKNPSTEVNENCALDSDALGVDEIRRHLEFLHKEQVHTATSLGQLLSLREDLFHIPNVHDRLLALEDQLLQKLTGKTKTHLAPANHVPTVRQTHPNLPHKNGSNLSIDSNESARGIEPIVPQDDELEILHTHSPTSPLPTTTTRFSVLRDLYGMSSDTGPSPPLAVEFPPPLVPVIYRPIPRPRSATPDFEDILIPQLTSIRPHARTTPRPRYMFHPSGNSRRSHGHTTHPSSVGQRQGISSDEAESGASEMRVRAQVYEQQDLHIPLNEPAPATSHIVPSGNPSVNVNALRIQPTRSFDLRTVPASVVASRSHQQTVQLNPQLVAPPEPRQTRHRKSSWYRRPPYRPLQEETGRPQVIVQFPTDALNPAIEIMQSIRRDQMTFVEQQRELTQSMQELNTGLERMVENRRREMGELGARLGGLFQNIQLTGSEPELIRLPDGSNTGL